MNAEIEKQLGFYLGINDKCISAVADLFSKITLKRNDFLLKEGQYTDRMSFIASGYMRVYALNRNGDKEITQWISNEEMFITDLSSFIFGTPSRWNIQALSDCELYTIPKDRYDQIGTLVDDWPNLEKLFITKCFVTLENRVFNQLSMTAEEKVNDLMEMNPDIFNQVPLQYIASMLGISPETLSRIRGKKIS